MDEAKKKPVMIAIASVCLIVAVGITVLSNKGSGGGSKVSDSDIVVMLCANPDCGIDYELTVEEYREQLQEVQRALGPMMMMGGNLLLTCPECEEQSAYKAMRCKECDFIFVPIPGSDDYRDRCPECGYSELEEIKN